MSGPPFGAARFMSSYPQGPPDQQRGDPPTRPGRSQSAFPTTHLPGERLCGIDFATSVVVGERSSPEEVHQVAIACGSNGLAEGTPGKPPEVASRRRWSPGQVGPGSASGGRRGRLRFRPRLPSPLGTPACLRALLRRPRCRRTPGSCAQTPQARLLGPQAVPRDSHAALVGGTLKPAAGSRV
jgi:hypothetical protein